MHSSWIIFLSTDPTSKIPVWLVTFTDGRDDAAVLLMENMSLFLSCSEAEFGFLLIPSCSGPLSPLFLSLILVLSLFSTAVCLNLYLLDQTWGNSSTFPEAGAFLPWCKFQIQWKFNSLDFLTSGMLHQHQMKKEPKESLRDPSLFPYISQHASVGTFTNVKDQEQQSMAWSFCKWRYVVVLGLSFMVAVLESVEQKGNVVEPWWLWLCGWVDEDDDLWVSWEAQENNNGKEEKVDDIWFVTNAGSPPLVHLTS